MTKSSMKKDRTHLVEINIEPLNVRTKHMQAYLFCALKCHHGISNGSKEQLDNKTIVFVRGA